MVKLSNISRGRWLTSLFTGLFVALMLTGIQTGMDKPFLLLERMFTGGGWIQTIIFTLYAFVVAFMISDPAKTARWRKISWFAFSVFFFAQLLLGLTVSSMFLMSGNLHLPLPFMILAGPVYRAELSVMSILFLSSVVLSGPAWCSHICYFGGLDNYFSGKKRTAKGFIHKFRYRHTVLPLVIGAALVLRLAGAGYILSLSLALAFGLGGILVMVLISPKKGKMAHCLIWCPVGTIVSWLKHINPFRMYIDKDCDRCFKCSLHCRYDALRKENILANKPGLSCTLCGDCVATCHSASLKYSFLKVPPVPSRHLYIFISVALHALSFSMARI